MSRMLLKHYRSQNPWLVGPPTRLTHNVSYHNINAIVNTNARKWQHKIRTIYTRHITLTNLIEQKTLITSYESYALETL
jgi:hypothetical protein